MENAIKVSKIFDFVPNTMQALITIFIKISVIQSADKLNVLNHHHYILLMVNNFKEIILIVIIKFMIIIAIVGAKFPS